MRKSDWMLRAALLAVVVMLLLGTTGCDKRIFLGTHQVDLNLGSTITSQPTYTLNPTFTPRPTYTPLPTYTPRPTYTLLPSATP